MLVCCLIIIYHIKIKSTFNLYRNIIWLWPEIILTFRMKVIFQTRQWDDPFSIWWSYITIMWCNQSCNSVMHHKELRSPPLPFYIWWLPCCDIQDEDLRFISNILRLFPDSRKFFCTMHDYIKSSVILSLARMIYHKDLRPPLPLFHMLIPLLLHTRWGARVSSSFCLSLLHDSSTLFVHRTINLGRLSFTLWLG